MKRHVELKNHQREIYYFRMRLALGVGFVLAMLVILLGRFVYLQVVRHEYFSTMAENNRISVVPIVPNRGLILDRNGVVLAHNYSGYTLEITPSKVGDLEATINAIAQVVDIQPKDRKRFKKLLDESHDFESIPIRNRLSDEEVARFAAQRYRFPGVEIKARLFREYPLREDTSHLIGYIGRINDDDIQQLEDDDQLANYRGSDYIGKSGIEQSYEKQLHGTTGFEQVEVDAGGRGVRVLSRTPPVSGNSLQLTLDAKLQQIAVQAFGDYRGALVAIDPNNGEVLAFVSKPGFDPNLFIDGIDSDSWDALNNSPDVPLLNRILHGQYPPGSTIKPCITARVRPAMPSTIPAISCCPAAAISTATGRRAATAGSTCSAPSSSRATRISTGWPTTWASTTCTTSWRSSASARRPASTWKAS
jgi:penicillin-binding protein 2